jgi:hypothetical protein
VSIDNTDCQELEEARLVKYWFGRKQAAFSLSPEKCAITWIVDIESFRQPHSPRCSCWLARPDVWRLGSTGLQGPFQSTRLDDDNDKDRLGAAKIAVVEAMLQKTASMVLV